MDLKLNPNPCFQERRNKISKRWRTDNYLEGIGGRNKRVKREIENIATILRQIFQEGDRRGREWWWEKEREIEKQEIKKKWKK